MGEIRVIQNRAGTSVVAFVEPEPPVRDQTTTSNFPGSKCSPIQLRMLAEAGIAESPDWVRPPRPSTPKEAASVRTDQVPPLKQRKKILAKRMAKK